MYDATNRQKTLKMTMTAVFIAILLLEAFIPNIGYITIFPGMPAVTTIPLTVAIYACLMGPKAGATFGLVWGLTSLFRAYTAPNGLVTILLFQNPLICLVPRILSGYLAGLVGKLPLKKKSLAYCLSGITASVTNTLFVILLSALWYGNNSHQLLVALGKNSGNLLAVLFVALGANCLLESAFSGIVTPVIASAVNKRLARR
ncbi:ECF transporter S component [Lactobacillus equicursoris]|uniref:ECF transporter S component n=1 Tax=Lactobacillus equicursoris TaxID=420645 RepID=UPI0024327C51|nr:ECF transporter S component [Lactobacillus equicursoris]MDD6386776.1 ECF transporter S component [Lactobacillus equicursoris]